MIMAGQRSRSAFRPGTVANHRSHILLFIAFALYFRVTDFPVACSDLLSFGEFLLRSYKAPKSVLNVFSTVRMFHVQFKFSPEVFDTLEVARWKRALFLTVRSVPQQAQPIPFPLLERLCALAEGLGGEGSTVAAFLSVGFHVFARASTLLTQAGVGYDVSRLPTLADVVPNDTGFSLTVKWDKTHQAAAQAFVVPVLRGALSPASPARALNRLLRAAEGCASSTPLFATIRGKGRARSVVPLTLRRAREWFRILLAMLNLQPDAYTLHSLRRGGCTLAFAGGGAQCQICSP